MLTGAKLLFNPQLESNQPRPISVGNCTMHQCFAVTYVGGELAFSIAYRDGKTQWVPNGPATGLTVRRQFDRFVAMNLGSGPAENGLVWDTSTGTVATVPRGSIEEFSNDDGSGIVLLSDTGTERHFVNLNAIP
jgi:hypothetical protein